MTTRHQSSVISHQSSVISHHQLSAIITELINLQFIEIDEIDSYN
jgi:hypothetical protein